jgi:hypothetical protein
MRVNVDSNKMRRTERMDFFSIIGFGSINSDENDWPL